MECYLKNLSKLKKLNCLIVVKKKLFNIDEINKFNNNNK